MNDTIEISPTRWSRIKIVIASILLTPVFGAFALLEGLPLFLRVIGAIVFVPLLIAIPLHILGIVKNRPSYVVSEKGIEVKELRSDRFLYWSEVKEIKLVDLEPHSRPIGESNVWGNLQIRLVLKNSSFWNRYVALNVGEANKSPSEALELIRAHLDASRRSAS